MLSHLHAVPLGLDAMQGYAAGGAFVIAQCVWPVVVGAMLSGLMAGAVQSRFQTASEALQADWNRINPWTGFKRLFSGRSVVPASVAFLKLCVVLALVWSTVRTVLNDPIFHAPVSVGRIGEFLAASAFSIMLRVIIALMVIAAADYGYQFWRSNRDLMMTRDEVKDETRNSEGSPQIKARMRKLRQRFTQRRMLAEVPKADVVVTNPTHIAVALRYDRKTMRAPRIVAKGSRLNAGRIREIAQQHQVPIVENKPLARLIFKHGKVGAEVPAQFYAAVAEILAWVYRVNRYRYYAEEKGSVSNH
jgi:flagellar biosynthetic protein FlhB